MELKSSVKLLRYVRKNLLGDTAGILPFPVRPQKPRPTGKKPARLPRISPGEAGVPPAALDTFFRELAEAPNINVHGCLVLRRGQVLCEGFFAPYSAANWHVTHSLCKSFTGTAVGMAVAEGKIDLNEKVCDIFPEKCSLLTSRRMRAVTVRHLLTMTSGASFREQGAVLESDWVKSFLESEVAFEPGAQFDYNSMNSYLLSAIVRRKTGLGLMDYLTPRLFEPLGFGDVSWETCPQGIEKGGWGMYVYLEDAAKLGQLYLQNGVWEADGQKKRILSAEWVAEASKAQIVSAKGEEYGYQMWPYTSEEMYMFNGMFGQYVVIAPKLEMVVAINSGAGNLFTKSPALQAVRRLLAAVEEGKQPLDAGGEALRFTLSHLVYGRPVPVPAEPPAPTLRQRFAAWLFPAPQPEPAAVRAGRLLDGKRYVFEKNKVGLMPVMIACMNDYYPKGLESVSFRYESGALWLNWNEAGAHQRVPLSFEKPLPFLLNGGGNLFSAVAAAQLTQNEDDWPVLKVSLCLLESSSSRELKCFFAPDGTLRLQLSETPALMLAMDSVFQSSPATAQAELLFRDMDYLHYSVRKFVTPLLEGTPAQEA